MDFHCKLCNKVFTTKANQERHEKTDKHLKCAACVSQPKITEFFVTEEKFAQHQEVVLVLSEKVSRLEMTTAALLEQTKSLHEQVSALTLSNVRLSHVAEIAELKLAHALELARAAPAPALAPAPAPAPAPIQAAKPRHTGAENHQALIEKWFSHPRNYGEGKDKEGDAKICGIRDLAVKLQTIYTENPDLAPGDNFTRLLGIYKKEVDSKTDNPNTLQTANMALMGCKRVFKWSKEDEDYLKYSISFESPNQLARHDMTQEDYEVGEAHAAKYLPSMPAPKPEPQTTASANKRMLAVWEKREADKLEAMEESNDAIRQSLAKELEKNIEYIETTYEDESWEIKNKIAEACSQNAKKVKHMLAQNVRDGDEIDLKEIRKEIAKLKK